jgi:hypothetical protein
MSPDEMQALLQAHNIGFVAKDKPTDANFGWRMALSRNVFDFRQGRLAGQGH